MSRTKQNPVRQPQISDYDLETKDSFEFIQHIEGEAKRMSGPQSKDGNDATRSSAGQHALSSAATARENIKESGDFWTSYFKKRHRTINQVPNSNQTINKSINKSMIEEDFSDPSNWEGWWIRSPLWRRFNVLWLVILLCIAIAQLCAAVIMFRGILTEHIIDPYICTTPHCQFMAKWFLDSLDESVSPCDNFYEFVCGKHIDENDDGFVQDERGQWDMNRARVEFGRQNILSLLLQNVNKDHVHDQHVKYFKNCLDPRLRDQFGLTGIRKMGQELFGNLTEIDASNVIIEQYAKNVLETIGDFALFDFELDGFPTIKLNVKASNSWKENLADSITLELLAILFPDLDKSFISEIGRGANGIKNNYNNIITQARTVKTNDDMCPTKLSGPFNISHVFALYSELPQFPLQYEYTNDEVNRYFYGLNNCWDNTLIPSNRLKSSYAAFWMLRLLVKGRRELSLQVFEDLKPFLKDLEVIKFEEVIRSKSYEFQCFQSLTRNLGYMPAHRYFEKLSYDPGVFLQTIEHNFYTNTLRLAEAWKKIPHANVFITERGYRLMTMTGERPYVFSSNIPTPFDKLTSEKEDLKLTDDHFINAFRGKKFTLRQALRWWKRFHSERYTLVWNSNTYELERGFHSVHPLDKTNAIFIPITYFLEPYHSEFLSIQVAGTTVLCMREMLSFVGAYNSIENVQERYPNNSDVMKEYMGTEGTVNTSCMYFNFDPLKTDDASRYSYMAKTDFVKFFQKEPALFYNVFALKAAHADSSLRQKILTTPFWELNEYQKQWVMSKKLPGLEIYTEEQLFFMATVRHYCRQRPRKNITSTFNEVKRKYAYYVTNILSTFMQMSEFSDAWMCPELSPMNPPNKCFP